MAVDSSSAGPIAGENVCNVTAPKEGVGDGHMSRRSWRGNDPRILQRKGDAGGEVVSRNARERSLETAEEKVVSDILQCACPKKILDGGNWTTRMIVVDEPVDDDRRSKVVLAIRLAQSGGDEPDELVVDRHVECRVTK